MVLRLSALLLVCAALSAQQADHGRQFVGVVDAGDATRTVPFKSGTEFPETCVAAKEYYNHTVQGLHKCNATGDGWKYVVTRYLMIGGSGAINLPSSTAHYGGMTGRPYTTVDGERQMLSPLTGTVIAVYNSHDCPTPAGSSQTSAWYLRVETTDYLIANIALNTNPVVINATGLAIPIAMGNRLQLKLVTPSWSGGAPTCSMGGAWLVVE